MSECLVVFRNKIKCVRAAEPRGGGGAKGPPPAPVKIVIKKMRLFIFHVSWPPSRKFLDPLFEFFLYSQGLTTVNVGFT